MENSFENDKSKFFFPSNSTSRKNFGPGAFWGRLWKPHEAPQTWNSLCLLLQAKLASSVTPFLSSSVYIIFNSPSLTALQTDLKLQHQTQRQQPLGACLTSSHSCRQLNPHHKSPDIPITSRCSCFSDQTLADTGVILFAAPARDQPSSAYYRNSRSAL